MEVTPAVTAGAREVTAGMHRPCVLLLRWRSFELDPQAPRTREGTNEEHLARKYAMTTDQAREAQRRVSDIGAEHGVLLRLDLARSGNTFDAHRLLHLAVEHGLQGQLKELARDYGITGVPFFVIDGRCAVAGAQRTDVLVDVLEQAWSEQD